MQACSSFQACVLDIRAGYIAATRSDFYNDIKSFKTSMNACNYHGMYEVWDGCLSGIRAFGFLHESDDDPSSMHAALASCLRTSW